MASGNRDRDEVDPKTRPETIPAGISWAEAGRLGLVDPLFAGVVEQAGPDLFVEAVNLRG